jgi:hypothetical protein
MLEKVRRTPTVEGVPKPSMWSADISLYEPAIAETIFILKRGHVPRHVR